MSKFQLPTQKGTELFPKTTQSPTVVRIAGVPPHTNLAREIVGMFRAQISHFHRSQAQKYSLSTIENYQAHTQYPGLKMMYTNLQGQETINIAVSKRVVEEAIRRQQDYKASIDYLLIELYSEMMLNRAFIAIYTVTLPHLADPNPVFANRFDTYRGTAGNENIGNTSDSTEPPVTQFATASTDEPTRPHSAYTISRTNGLIDLTQLRGQPLVKIDIYAVAAYRSTVAPRPYRRYGYNEVNDNTAFMIAYRDQFRGQIWYPNPNLVTLAPELVNYSIRRAAELNTFPHVQVAQGQEDEGGVNWYAIYYRMESIVRPAPDFDVETDVKISIYSRKTEWQSIFYYKQGTLRPSPDPTQPELSYWDPQDQSFYVFEPVPTTPEEEADPLLAIKPTQTIGHVLLRGRTAHDLAVTTISNGFHDLYGLPKVGTVLVNDKAQISFMREPLP